MAETLTLDWSTAAVSGDTLTVQLSAEPPKPWRKAFEGTAVLLDRRHWKVAISTKGAITVAGIAAGDEDEVRSFLEGSTLQANATLVSEDELFGREAIEHDEQEPEDEDEPAAESDEDLTARFQSFAGEADEPGSEAG
jgi:hypothetical protein